MLGVRQDGERGRCDTGLQSAAVGQWSRPGSGVGFLSGLMEGELERAQGEEECLLGGVPRVGERD